MPVSRTRHYRVIIERLRGPLPLPCDHCAEVIERWGTHSEDGVIHHVDEDRDNNDPANLEVLHVRCHLAHHRQTDSPEAKAAQLAALRSWTWTEEAKAAQSARLKGRPKTPEHRAAIAAGKRGVRATPEHRAKLSAVRSARVRCPDCSFESNQSHVTYHRRLKH